MSPSVTGLLVLLLIALSSSTQAAIERSEEESRGLYQLWLAKHRKSYNAIGENEKRFEIFKDNLKFIDEHNSVSGQTYKLGLNKFADLTNEEYRSKYLGARFDPEKLVLKAKNASPRYAHVHGEKLPKAVDWRTNGAVNHVKDQGQCAWGPKLLQSKNPTYNYPTKLLPGSYQGLHFLYGSRSSLTGLLRTSPLNPDPT